MAVEQEEYATLKFDVRDGVAHLTLNRPGAYNALNIEMAQDLLRAVLRCDEDPSVRAVVIAGEGPTFCVGGDLKAFLEQEEQLPRHLKEVTTYLHAAVSRMARMDPPVVVADDELSEEAIRLATWLAAGATKALGATKRLLHSGWSGTLETQMEHETQAIAEMARTADGREGIAAFVEKRPAEFTGR